MRSGFALALLLLASAVAAQPAPELTLVSEHAVEGMRGGNLSEIGRAHV